MNIRFYNVRVLTMEEGRGIFEGEVWIKGKEIAYVGPTKDASKETWDREIDGTVICCFPVLRMRIPIRP